ncbi:MAG: hypothetical protein AAB842_02645 [Patescibacteria group bacterium]
MSRNNKNIYKDNEDFFAGMNEDAVQQQIMGEARMLRGLLSAIHKRRSFWIMLGALVLGGLFFFVGLMVVVVIILGSIASIQQKQYASLLLIISVPGIISYLFLTLGIKVIWHLILAYLGKNNRYRIIFVVVFLLFILLFSVVSYQLALIFSQVSWAG